MIAVARLKPGVSPQAADVEAQTIARRYSDGASRGCIARDRIGVMPDSACA